jgi:hypothetical protein
MAISLHAFLLLIPALQEDLLETGSTPLRITLLTPNLTASPFIEELAPERTASAEDESSTALQSQQPVPEFEGLKSAEDQAEPEPPQLMGTLTTARLLDKVEKMDWVPQETTGTRQLGIFIPQALPDNWKKSKLTGDAIFNPMVLPRKTEIVDRWLEVDGSHNVIVNTSGGQTLCGRALPWDPMRPFIEPLMQFRLCSGSENRISEMTKRIKRSTSSPL